MNLIELYVKLCDQVREHELMPAHADDFVHDAEWVHAEPVRSIGWPHNKPHVLGMLKSFFNIEQAPTSFPFSPPKGLVINLLRDNFNL